MVFQQNLQIDAEEDKMKHLLKFHIVVLKKSLNFVDFDRKDVKYHAFFLLEKFGKFSLSYIRFQNKKSDFPLNEIQKKYGEELNELKIQLNHHE